MGRLTVLDADCILVAPVGVAQCCGLISGTGSFLAAASRADLDGIIVILTEVSQLLIDIAGDYVRPNRDEVRPRWLFANRRRVLADQWACCGRADVGATIQRPSWV